MHGAMIAIIAALSLHGLDDLGPGPIRPRLGPPGQAGSRSACAAHAACAAPAYNYGAESTSKLKSGGRGLQPQNQCQKSGPGGRDESDAAGLNFARTSSRITGVNNPVPPADPAAESISPVADNGWTGSGRG